MNCLKMKLAFSAVAVAMLATPALAQPIHSQVQQQQQAPAWYNGPNAVVSGGRYQGTDPDPNVRLQLEKDGGDYGPSAY
jgi:hypothetical protein